MHVELLANIQFKDGQGGGWFILKCRHSRAEQRTKRLNRTKNSITKCNDKIVVNKSKKKMQVYSIKKWRLGWDIALVIIDDFIFIALVTLSDSKIKGS